MALDAVRMFSPLAKWWVLEIRFARRLNSREQRILAHLDPNGCDGVTVDRDGLLLPQWWNKWPSDAHDGERVRAVLGRIGLPGRLRCVPYGDRCLEDGCRGYGFFDSDDPDGACRRGGGWSCSEHLLVSRGPTDPDWRVFDPRAVGVVHVADSVSAFAGQESA